MALSSACDWMTPVRRNSVSDSPDIVFVRTLDPDAPATLEGERGSCARTPPLLGAAALLMQSPVTPNKNGPAAKLAESKTNDAAILQIPLPCERRSCSTLCCHHRVRRPEWHIWSPVRDTPGVRELLCQLEIIEGRWVAERDQDGAAVLRSLGTVSGHRLDTDFRASRICDALVYEIAFEDVRQFGCVLVQVPWNLAPGLHSQ